MRLDDFWDAGITIELIAISADFMPANGRFCLKIDCGELMRASIRELFLEGRRAIVMKSSLSQVKLRRTQVQAGGFG